MRQKISFLMIIFTLLFSISFSIGSDMIVIADTPGDETAMKWNVNIEDGDKDIPIDKVIIFKFNNDIERGPGNIILYTDAFEEKEIEISIDNEKLTINPVNDLKYLTRYILVLEKDSVVDSYYNSIDEVSYTFTTEKKPEKKDDDSEKEEQTHGQRLGQILGQLHGYMDFSAKRKNDWARAIPSDQKIISEYNLNRETTGYKNSFLIDFRDGFKKGYEDAYRNANFGTVLTSHTDGAGHGRLFGTMLGEIHGKKDFYNNRTNDWTRWIPPDRSIINEYGLLKDDSDYTDSFIHAFKDAYKLSYINSFRATNLEDNKIIKENGMNHGQIVGILAGDIQGKLDYMAGKDNDWRSNLPTDRVLIETYNLDREHTEYMEGFLAGYKEGYRDAYVLTFQGENLQVSAGNLNTEYISMHGGTAGSFDGEMILGIEPGTIYAETALTISKLNSANLPVDTHVMPATSCYNVKVQNASNSMELKKPIVLAFQYHGPETAGIYELKDGKWFYLHSTVEDNQIFTIINTNKYTGGTYVVLIDERHVTMDDIGGHWAVKPIDTFLKRNYINGYPDKTFRPDQSITRAELVKILDDVHNWSRYLPYAYGSRFADSSVFGVFTNSISRATSLGYVKGYDDNTFRPHIPITYQEVEWLMQRITGRYDFKWDMVAEKILTDYYIRSKSYNGKQNYINRAEVVYLLYSLEEGIL